MKKTLFAAVVAVMFSLFVGVGTAFAAVPNPSVVDPNGMAWEGITIQKEVKSDVVIFEAPVVPGKVFKGWYVSGNKSIVPSLDDPNAAWEWSSVFTVNMNEASLYKAIYAVYNGSHKITTKALTTTGKKLKNKYAYIYTSMGKKYSLDVERDVPYNTVASNNVKGYMFRGWYQADPTVKKGYSGVCISKDVTFSTEATRDLNLVAVYKKAKKGLIFTHNEAKYIITSTKSHKVSLKKANDIATFELPATIKVAGHKYKVTGIKAKAFKGTHTQLISVRTKYLTKKGVKNSLKDSHVQGIVVQIFKKEQKNYPYGINGKYGQIFTYENCGRSVGVWCEGR